MDPTVPIPIRCVLYTGHSLVRNGHALAVRDQYAYDIAQSDDVDVDRVGIGIVTAAPDKGIRGTGDAQNFPKVHVVLAREARQETDQQILSMLQVIDPMAVTLSIGRLIQQAEERGDSREDLIIVMHERLYYVMAAHGLAARAFADGVPDDGSEGLNINEVEGLVLGGVDVVMGVTDPGYWFHLTKKLE